MSIWLDHEVRALLIIIHIDRRKSMTQEFGLWLTGWPEEASALINTLVMQARQTCRAGAQWKVEPRDLRAVRHTTLLLLFVLIHRQKAGNLKKPPQKNADFSSANLSWKTSLAKLFSPSSDCPLSLCPPPPTPTLGSRWDYPSQQAAPINTPAHPLINTPLVHH